MIATPKPFEKRDGLLQQWRRLTVALLDPVELSKILERIRQGACCVRLTLADRNRPPPADYSTPVLFHQWQSPVAAIGRLQNSDGRPDAPAPDSATHLKNRVCLRRRSARRSTPLAQAMPWHPGIFSFPDTTRPGYSADRQLCGHQAQACGPRWQVPVQTAVRHLRIAGVFERPAQGCPVRTRKRDLTARPSRL